MVALWRQDGHCLSANQAVVIAMHQTGVSVLERSTEIPVTISMPIEEDHKNCGDFGNGVATVVCSRRCLPATASRKSEVRSPTSEVRGLRPEATTIPLC